MPKWYEGVKIVKDPSDVVDVVMDFSPLLASDTIDTASVAGTSITIDSTSTAANAVTVFVSGGTNGSTGEIKFTITTTGGRTFERTVLAEIRNL